MATLNFNIPLYKAALLEEGDDYFVRDVCEVSELSKELKLARERLRDESFEFIIDKFDVYYSVIHHEDRVKVDIIDRAFADLHSALRDLNNTLGFLLEDKDSLNDELKLKYLNLVKMLLYIYIQVVILLERVSASKSSDCLLRGKKKSKNEETVFVDRLSIIGLIVNILHRELSLFWDPPVVEETFVNLLSEIFYRFIQNPAIKSNKDLKAEMFNLIGILIKKYNHGETFVLRSVQLIKLHEHLTQYLPEGVQQLVKNFNCKSLVHDLVREATEWQTDEKYQDSHGSKYCSLVLSEMAKLMPDLMIPEVLYLSKYLAHDSAALRIAVLMVIAEVVVKVLTNNLQLSDEDRESRDELLSILSEHLIDVSALVRSKCCQLWAMLQKEMAIPIKYQHVILKDIISHLQDKSAVVRKSAANCVTTFLTHNPFGSNLQQQEVETELKKKQCLLDEIVGRVNETRQLKMKELEVRWSNIVKLLKPSIEKELEKDLEPSETEIPEEEVNELIRMYLLDGKFLEAFQLCRMYFDKFESFQKIRDEMDEEANEVDLFLAVMHNVFLDFKTPLADELVSREDLRNFEALEKAVDFCKDTLTFLELIDGAIRPMVELLDTTAVGDMSEAIEFFISAYQFNIQNAGTGILAMLNIMKRNEQDRKDNIIKAFKTIYLNTDTNNMVEHASTVVNRLIALLKNVPVNNYDDLQMIISEWTAKGTLDNNIIDMLWQYFSQKVPVSDDDCCSAVLLLRMAAMGRRTIIGRNIKVVAAIAFSERGLKNNLLLSACLELLVIAGKVKLDVNSHEPQFRIPQDDELFINLSRVLTEDFFLPKEFFSKVIFAGIDVIYRLCSKPERVCEDIILKVMSKLTENVEENGEQEIEKFVFIRICQLLGAIAIRHLEFLDDVVYKELKRRNNIRDEKKQGKKNNKKPGRRNNQSKRSTRKSMNASEAANTSCESVIRTSVIDSTLNEEVEMEGALAEDEDAEFILNVLEKDTVTGSGGLGKLAHIIINICQRPNRYNDEMLQGAAVIALIRYMLISGKFCEDNIQLLFTIFEKTESSVVKCTILFHCSDLLTRFPNIVEPWTDKIFDRLKDQNMEIRRTTFFTLSNLILRDMIRVHSRISALARCIVDDDEQLKTMSRTFFFQLSHKENNLYNVLPDIWSHLAESGDIGEEELKTIMKFLFDLIGKSKYMENLVDRFCMKFCLTEDERLHASISYCLTLISYNEKGLKNLIENFKNYKHVLHIADVHNNFKQIIASCNKQQTGKVDLKPIVAELEQQIKSVFEVGDGSMKPPPPPPSSKKSAKKVRPKSVQKRRRKVSSDDDDDDEDLATVLNKENSRENGQEGSLRRSTRSRRNISVQQDDSF